MKKLFGILVSMLAAIVLLPGVASAANQASIDGTDTEYDTLENAITSASDNDTIVLLGDVTDCGLTINKPLTIDLGGHTLSCAGTYVFDIYSDLKLQNGNIVVTGLDNGGGIWLNGSASLDVAEDVTLTVKDSASDEASVMIGFWTDCDGASLNLDGTIISEMGITINGLVKTPATNTITIGNTAKIIASDTAIYLAGNGETTIGTAEITGLTGVEIRAGSLTVNGATITATGEFNATPNGNGTTTSGAAIAISQHTTNLPIDVTLNGGSFTGAKAIYEADLQDATGSDDVAIDVAGGNYNGEVASVNHTEFVSGGIFSQPVEAAYVVPASTVANRTSGDTTTYFIGTPTTVAANLADTKAGDAIEVTQGDLELAALPGDVTVKNTGEGTVTANGETATAEGVTTVAPAEPETDPISPPTGDAFNPVVWAIVTGLAAILFGATLYQSRKQRR